MSEKIKSTNTAAQVVKAILSVLIVAALIAGVVFMYKFTNGFNEDFKSFYVEYNGNKILSADSEIALKTDNEYRFNVKYTFDNHNAEPRGYNVKIVPHVTKDFIYYVDGEPHSFSEINLDYAFRLWKFDSYFDLQLTRDLTFGNVLRRAAQGGAITMLPDNALTDNPYPFTIQISSYDNSVTYNINFTLIEFGSGQTGGIEPGGGQTGGTEPGGGQTGGTEPGGGQTGGTGTEKILYDIGYEVHGSLSDIYVNTDLPKQASAGETVTFEACIDNEDPEVAKEHIIESIDVRLPSGEIYIQGLQPNDGVYSFIMPDLKAMYEDWYVTVWIYTRHVVD